MLSRQRYVLVAQPDRVFGYEPKGRGFESLLTRQKKTIAKAIVFFRYIRLTVSDIAPQ